MTNILKEAMAKAVRLPKATQEKIGGELLLHIDKLRRLRTKLDKGILSLNRGEGRELNLKDVIRRARARHEKA